MLTLSSKKWEIPVFFRELNVFATKNTLGGEVFFFKQAKYLEVPNNLVVILQSDAEEKIVFSSSTRTYVSPQWQDLKKICDGKEADMRTAKRVNKSETHMQLKEMICAN